MSDDERRLALTTPTAVMREALRLLHEEAASGKHDFEDDLRAIEEREANEAAESYYSK